MDYRDIIVDDKTLADKLVSMGRFIDRFQALSQLESSKIIVVFKSSPELKSMGRYIYITRVARNIWRVRVKEKKPGRPSAPDNVVKNIARRLSR